MDERIVLPLAGVIAGVGIVPIALVSIFLVAAEGHGSQLLVTLFFPLTMFVSSATANLIIAAVQFPIYGLFAGLMLSRRRRLVALVPIGFHLAVVFVGLVLGLAQN